MTDSTSNDVLNQLSQTWAEAQRQLAELRTQVEQTSVLAHAKVQGDLLRRELDQAFRALGEAVWEAAQQGTFTLPAQLTQVSRAVEEVSRHLRAHQESLADLLKEGDEAADRLQKSKSGAALQSDVASRLKKR